MDRIDDLPPPPCVGVSFYLHIGGIGDARRGVDSLQRQETPVVESSRIAALLRVRLAQRDEGKRIEATVQLQTLFVPGSLPDGGEIRPVQLAVRLNQVNPFAPPYVPPTKPPH